MDNPFMLGSVWGVQAGWNATTQDRPSSPDGQDDDFDLVLNQMGFANYKVIGRDDQSEVPDFLDSNHKVTNEGLIQATDLSDVTGIGAQTVQNLRERFADIIPTSIPVFPSGEWEKAVNDGWYRAVAPNVDPNS